MSSSTDPLTSSSSRTTSAARRDDSSTTERASTTDPDFEALRNRESWAVQRWIVPERHYLRGVLARYGVPRRELEELVQETLYQVLRSLPDFQGASRLRTWLYSIARNVAYQFHREDSRQSSYAPEDMDIVQDRAPSSPCLAETESDPHHTTVRREQQDIVHQALDKLPDHYRQVIRLRDLDERTTAEAAAAIGITNVNTRVRLHRARHALRGALRQYVTNRRDAGRILSSR